MPVILKKESVAEATPAPKNEIDYKFESPKAAKLGELITATIASEPFEFEGYVWGGRTQPEWADAACVSLRTLERLIKKPPFVKTITHDSVGNKITLLRVGTPGPRTPRHVANIMSRVFEEKVRWKHSQKDYGCLLGLAKAWPDGVQVDIFRCVLTNWKQFMGAAKLELEVAADQGGEPVKHRFYKWPTIPFILKTHGVALDFYIEMMQHKGKPIPPAVMAMKPEIWPKAKAAQQMAGCP